MRPVFDGDGAVMRGGDAGHDGKAQTAALGPRAITSPEALEDRLAFRQRHARSLIENEHRAVGGHVDLDRAAGRAMANGVLDQVSHRSEKRLGVTAHPDRGFRAGERDGLAIVHGQRRHEGHGIGTDSLQIRLRAAVHDEGLEFGDVEDLVHRARHVDDVVLQRLPHRRILQRIDARPHDGQRRPQLVRHVGGEFALRPVSRLEPVERLVHRVDERHDLGRHRLLRQPDVSAGRPDRRGGVGGLPHGIEGTAEDHDVDQQQHQQDRKGDPGDARQERGDDIVDDDVAMREILPDLDPVEVVADGARHVDPDQHRAVSAPTAEGIVGQRLTHHREGKIVAAGREQDPALRIEDGIGVETVTARIDRLGFRRDLEGEVAGGGRPHEARDRERLGAQCIAMEAVGRLVEQPIERQRHQDRRHADRHDMQRDDAGDDRSETVQAAAFSSASR